MKRYCLTFLILAVISSAYGQNERKVIRDGVKAYEDGVFDEAEVQFRKAESMNQESFEAEFNTGAALYVASVVGSIADGYEAATQALASGAVREKIERVVACSQALKGN